MTNTDLKNKTAQLQALLHSYGKIAVAYSGGVDSSLLLRVAGDTLGPEKVTALHAISCLTPVPDRKKAEKRVVSQKGFGCSYRAVRLYPFRWPEFVANTGQRCYFCKKRMYGILQSELPPDGSVLVDGTNSDDLRVDRPGLAAIRELSVLTPLALAGLTKREIRSLARQKGLVNWNQPANSCLATRVAVHQRITGTLLTQIEKAERFLHGQGFAACRVKPGKESTIVEIPDNDLERFRTASTSFELAARLKHLGLPSAPLEITGRSCL